MGRTFTDYLNQLRVETACALPTGTSLPVTGVAARSGYRNLSNFNRRFRELNWLRPTEFRAAHREPPPAGPPDRAPGIAGSAAFRSGPGPRISVPTPEG